MLTIEEKAAKALRAITEGCDVRKTIKRVSLHESVGGMEAEEAAIFRDQFEEWFGKSGGQWQYKLNKAPANVFWLRIYKCPETVINMDGIEFVDIEAEEDKVNAEIVNWEYDETGEGYGPLSRAGIIKAIKDAKADLDQYMLDREEDSIWPRMIG